jgi:outer membrane protein TolC
VRQCWKRPLLLIATLLGPIGEVHDSLRAQESTPPLPRTEPGERPLSITLPTALKLAHAQARDITIASDRIAAATAQVDQADVLWLPTITLGGDYNRHDGRNQDTQGNVFDNSRSSAMLGVGTGIGPAAILNVNDALFTPLAARQQLAARQADLQATANDTLLSVTDAYFNVQQARGELAGALDAARRTEELVRRTRQLARELVPELEVDRAEAEMARREQAESLARERWKIASADLLRVLAVDPTAQVEPAELPSLRIDLIDLNHPIDDLVVFALTHRPELASQQAQVQATLTLLKQERFRPLIPSVLLRGYSTPVTGTLAAGYFGGGSGSTVGNGGLRGDFDLQLLWQLDNLGFGNHAKIRLREAERRQALHQLFRLQDTIAAEVARAHAQVQQAIRRVGIAARGVRAARASADKNLAALSQTKQVGGTVQLLVRPQEALAAVQALGQAYADYYASVADCNRAQFRLYRALGHPAHEWCVEPAPSSPPSLAGKGAGGLGSSGRQPFSAREGGTEQTLLPPPLPIPPRLATPLEQPRP